MSRLRNKDGFTSFDEPEYWSIRPNGSNFNDRKTALLINRNTQSAAELFALMMQRFSNVILVGDTTAGIFADTHISKLPNNWELRISVRETNNAEDISLEGIGIPPDKTIKNTKADIEEGRDKVVEYALNYLNK